MNRRMKKPTQKRVIRSAGLFVIHCAALLALICGAEGAAMVRPVSWCGVNGTVASDGPLAMDDSVYVTAWWHDPYAKTQHRCVRPYWSSQNVGVLDVDGQRVVVDTGSYLPPDKRTPTLRACGRLLDSLCMVGIDEASVDAVLITHGHPDHILGLTREGEGGDGESVRAFPNAIVYISRREHEYILSLAQVDVQKLWIDKFYVAAYLQSIAPYAKAGALRLVEDGESPLRGVTFRPAPGHTPGHCVIEVQATGHTRRLVMIGDTWTRQFDNPGVDMQFDVNPRQAIFTRLHVLDLLAQRGDLVLSYHDIFPGLGFVRRARAPDGTASYHWVTAPIDELLPEFSASQQC